MSSYTVEVYSQNVKQSEHSGSMAKGWLGRLLRDAEETFEDPKFKVFSDEVDVSIDFIEYEYIQK